MKELIVKKAKKIIKDNIYFTVATSEKNNPWITPLRYVCDDKLNFYWISPNNTRHSKIITDKNSNIAFTIFDPSSQKGEGIYAEARALELKNEDEIAKILKLLYIKMNRELPPVKEFLGNASWRVYKAIPKSLLLRDRTKKYIKIK